MFKKICSTASKRWQVKPVRYKHADPLSPYPPDLSRVEKLTICGALNPLGQHLAFLLKKKEIIKEISLHDDGNVRGLALDLGHMSSRTKVKPHSGDYELKSALRNADMVVITNGFDVSPEGDDQCGIKANASLIYKYGVKIGHICPDALVCLATSPINLMLPILSEAMKGFGMYDPNKVLGVTSLMEMRANSIVADYLSIDPAAINVPIIGGTTPSTIVPILSQAKPYNEFTDAETAELTNAITQVPSQCKKLHTSAPLSTAYALSRFVLTAAAGLCTIGCPTQTAFVRSSAIQQVKYFASSLRFGRMGITENLGIPKLSDRELYVLTQALVALEADIAKAMSLFSEISMCLKKDEMEGLYKPKKPFISKMPCSSSPPCVPTDICPEKVPGTCSCSGAKG